MARHYAANPRSRKPTKPKKRKKTKSQLEEVFKLKLWGKGGKALERRLLRGIHKSADACKIDPPLCIDNLGISRSDMPQLSDDVIPDFLDSLESGGVTIMPAVVPVGKLRTTQRELKADTLLGMAKSYRDGKFKKLKAPIIVSSDGHILDGHHRWGAVMLEAPTADMNVYIVDLPIDDLLHAANNFKGVTQRGFGVAANPHNRGALNQMYRDNPLNESELDTISRSILFNYRHALGNLKRDNALEAQIYAERALAKLAVLTEVSPDWGSVPYTMQRLQERLWMILEAAREEVPSTVQDPLDWPTKSQRAGTLINPAPGHDQLPGGGQSAGSLWYPT